MSTTADEHDYIITQLVTYSVTDAEIATRQARYALLSADTTKGYEEVRLAIADLREARITIEKRRVELKADALAYGRLVDSEAKRLTCLLEDIEEPLKRKRAAVDDEKARIRAEAEAAKLRALEAEIAAKRAQQEAEAKVVRDAEEARLAEERARLDAERLRLTEERRRADEAARIEREAAEAKARTEREQLAKERRIIEEAQHKERDAIERERQKVVAEREKAERAEFERKAKVKAEKEAAENAERERIAAAKRQARLDALRPDVEKISSFAETIRGLVPPKTKSTEARTTIEAAVNALANIAIDLETTVRKWKSAA